MLQAPSSVGFARPLHHLVSYHSSFWSFSTSPSACYWHRYSLSGLPCVRVERTLVLLLAGAPPFLSDLPTFHCCSERSLYSFVRLGKGTVPSSARASLRCCLGCQSLPARLRFGLADRQVRRAGIEPAQLESGWFTATWARQCPADAFSSLRARVRVETIARHGGLSSVALPAYVPCQASVPDGI